MIAVENVGTQVNRKLQLGRVRLGVADAPGSKQLVEFARTIVAPGSLIRTDGARMFRVLAQEGYTRHCQLQQSEGDFRRFASAIHQVACDL